MKKYIPAEIESKWQKKWEERKIYQAGSSSKKPKKYILDMFPYPSGDGLHVGHFKGYTATDVLSRYFRARGFSVLHPMGWDAFGLPAENYAIKMRIHPKITTQQNIANIKRQMQMVGLSYDWTREVDTTDPNYYKWTQWIFLKMFEKGLAYEDDAPINWCPVDKTGLANEEVADGKCVRCGSQVEIKKIRQWILKITDYADRLLEDLSGLDWPRAIKDMQINWIGRSDGIVIKFDELEVFTTRQDTIFGTSFIVISPEHPLLSKLTLPEKKKEIGQYIKNSAKKSELERKENKDKTGVFTGSFVKNPINGEKIPVWVADYVLSSYGTGVVMGVPAHDERDFKFAKKYDLPINPVIANPEGVKQSKANKEIASSSTTPRNDDRAYEGEGIMINSGDYNGLTTKDAKQKISNYLEEHQLGKRKINYHLRDWVFSRQRYWGEPIPLIHCGKCGIVPLSETELPLILPEVEKYEPTGTGESPLANIPEWVNTKCPKCGGSAKRETNTMPQWAGSCWYYLRFCDPKNDQQLVSKEIEKYWLPVDWYVGGAEHAVLHLLYARFWHKFLFDLGVIVSKEPFQKLSNVGLVLAADGRKMSKSLGNVVTPDEIVKEYGADTLRLYELFMGPFENAISWDPTSINGVYKFLNRVWEVINNDHAKNEDIEATKALHRLIKKVSGDVEQIKLNTAISAMMEFINLIFHKSLSIKQKQEFLILLAPFAPHITEELWQAVGEKFSVHQQSWPEFDNKYLEEASVNIIVQINGKVRDVMMIQKDIISNKEVVEKMAKGSEKIKRFTHEQSVKKIVYIPGKIINFVT